MFINNKINANKTTLGISTNTYLLQKESSFTIIVTVMNIAVKVVWNKY